MTCVEVTTKEEFRACVERGDCIHVRLGEWTASDSAQVRASGSAQVRASGSAQVRASRFVAVTIHGEAVRAEGGGVHVRIPRIETVADWCDFYGLTVHDGAVTLYKAVHDDYRSAHGVSYAPGSQPSAPDWDGGEAECGGGLHFSPRPFMALSFNAEASHFIACPVAIADIRAPRPGDHYPAKVKASRVCAPVYEVDLDGNRIADRSEAA